MKQINWFNLRKNNRLLSFISVVVLVAYVNMTISCSYFKVNTLDPLSTESVVSQLQKKGKYIIIHYQNSAWHLANTSLNDGTKELRGNLETLSAKHKYYLKAKKGGKANRYKHAKKADRPIYEVHIYVDQNPQTSSPEVSIPFAMMNKIEVYDQHTGATILSVLGTIAIVGGLLAIIIIATKSSCPFVYTGDGEDYYFAGEIYGGAIFSSLERDDYMQLPGFYPIDGKYHLQISNELLERQYTNLATLVVAEHPSNISVLLDKNGSIETIINPQTPTEAQSNNIDMKELILAKDSNSFLFNETKTGDNASNLILTFKRPDKSAKAKLIINAKNSYWLDYIYGKFNEQFGTYYNTFAEEQKKVPAGKNIKWTLDQQIPLSVYVETEKGWKFVDYFNSMGPLAARDLVMPIDLTDVKGETVRVKLQCGFMFWEVDHASMDFTENIPVNVSTISPSFAMDEHGKDVVRSITAVDDNYLFQPEIGNVATIEYPSTTPAPGKIQTVFLHSRGYYEYIREYKNWPDVNYLETFKNKGAFTRFSKEQYDVIMNDPEIYAAAFSTTNPEP